MLDCQAGIVADDPCYQALQFDFVTNKDQFNVAVSLQRRASRAHDHLGTEVAAHRIQGEG
jgi:hypothetical protein